MRFQIEVAAMTLVILTLAGNHSSRSSKPFKSCASVADINKSFVNIKAVATHTRALAIAALGGHR